MSNQDITPVVTTTAHGVDAVCSEECPQWRGGFCQVQQYVFPRTERILRKAQGDVFVQAVCFGVSRCLPWYRRIVEAVAGAMSPVMYLHPRLDTIDPAMLRASAVSFGKRFVAGVDINEEGDQEIVARIEYNEDGTIKSVTPIKVGRDASEYMEGRIIAGLEGDQGVMKFSAYSVERDINGTIKSITPIEEDKTRVGEAAFPRTSEDDDDPPDHCPEAM